MTFGIVFGEERGGDWYPNFGGQEWCLWVGPDEDAADRRPRPGAETGV